MRKYLFLAALSCLASAHAQTVNYTASSMNTTDIASPFSSSPANGVYGDHFQMGINPGGGTLYTVGPDNYTQGAVTTRYDFDYVLTGGTLQLNGALQFADYIISLITTDGGRISAASISYDWNTTTYTENVDYTVLGVNSDSVLLNSQNSGDPGRFGGFNGTLTITGAYTGIELSQLYDSDYANTRALDSNAYIQLSGAVVENPVPEPSSTSLLGALAGVLALRRKRVSRQS